MKRQREVYKRNGRKKHERRSRWSWQTNFHKYPTFRDTLQLSHCVWGERSAPSELLSSTDTTSPHQAQARLVDTTNLPPPPPPSSVPSLNSQDAGFGLDITSYVYHQSGPWCGLVDCRQQAMSCHR